MAPKSRGAGAGGARKKGGGSAAAPAAKRRRTTKADVEAAPAEAEEWSYDRLWDAREVSGGWHDRNLRFWRSQAPDVRGATGGGVSQRDLAFSLEALADLAAGRQASGAAAEGRFQRALDLGAGIGRVTDAVLRRHCSHVDLVEFVQKHLRKAKEKLPSGGKAGCTFAFFNEPVQKFKVPRGRYDLVWCQWLLMYLTDADAIALLRRLGAGLAAAGGVLVVKENISTPDKLTYFDDDQGELWEEGDGGGGPVSCVRTELHYEDLFQRAGLLIKEQKVQRDPSAKTMDMMLYVLVAASSAPP